MIDLGRLPAWATLLVGAAALASVHCSSSSSDAPVTAATDAGTTTDGGATTTNDAGADAAPQGPFSLALLPATLAVAQGRSAQVTVTITRSDSFQGPVRIELDALPAGVTATPLKIANSETSGVLYVSATAATSLANATVTVRGVADGAEVSASYPLRIVGPPGTLDQTFGTGGKVTTAVGPRTNDTAVAALAQKDGKVIVVGTSDQGTSLDFALARYAIDGTLDPTFGNNGVALTNFDYAQDAAYAATFDSVGRIVVVGTTAAQTTQLAVARYKADGTPDLGFGIDGKLALSVTGPGDVPTSVAVDSQDRILVGLRSVVPTQYSYRTVRIDAPGVVDSMFGSATGTLFSQTYTYPRAIFLLPQAGDQLVVLGNTTYGTQGSACTKFALERYSSSGGLDTAFGTAGHTYTSLPQRCSHPGAIAAQSDGKILVAGNTSFDTIFIEPRDLGVARYTADGQLDTSWNTTGTVTVGMANQDAQATGVAQQSDKKVVVSGWTADNFVSMRFLPDGSPDPDWYFGTAQQLDFGASDIASALVLLPDDRVVIVGTSGGKFALARYWP